MEALVLERKGELSLRDIDLPLEVGSHDVKIAIHTVGICASDVHYYEHGAIGPFVVKEPMVLGHEAAGTVVEVGAQVKHLALVPAFHSVLKVSWKEAAFASSR